MLVRRHPVATISALSHTFGLAALALGFYLYLLARGADAGGSVSAVFGARSMSALLLLGLAAALRSPLRLDGAPLAAVSLIGVTAAGALVLFGYATSLGLISITTI